MPQSGIIDKVAWIELDGGRVLSTRSHGKDAYYLPGGKREPGESDVQTLVREVREELGVAIDAGSAEHFGEFRAQAHGHPTGVDVVLACYTAAYTGTPAAAGEIAEIAWLRYADRHRVSEVDTLIFDRLHRDGLLS